MTYDSLKDTPHPMVETWAMEWAIAVYAGTDWTWIERIELARLALRMKAENARLKEEIRGRRYTGKCDYVNKVLNPGTKCGEPAQLLEDRGGPGSWSAWRCDRHTDGGYPL